MSVHVSLPIEACCTFIMKILCVIDNLSTGGAQRQIINLANGLHSRGHQVSIFCYAPGDMLAQHLAKEGIIVDPYNRNWFIHGFSFDQRFLDNELLEYVDLAYMHSLDTNHKVKAIIEALRPLNC